MTRSRREKLGISVYAIPLISNPGDFDLGYAEKTMRDLGRAISRRLTREVSSQAPPSQESKT